MELQKWKVFKYIDSHFASNVKRAYLVGITTLDDDFNNIEYEGREEALPWSGGVMVMKNGDVYFTTITTNDVRKIQIKKDEHLIPHVPVKLDVLCGQEIRDVQSGKQQVVVLTTNGRVFHWGDFCSPEEQQRGVCQVSFLSGNNAENERVIQIACGENHALALTAKGQVYSWGSDDEGQLGAGPDSGGWGPFKISGTNEFYPRISQIACGDVTSHALDNQGNVWSWGYLSNENHNYEGGDHYQEIPLKITDLHDITMVAAGGGHVLALSEGMELFVWGHHASGARVVTPTRMEVSNIESIGATRACSISAFKTTEGKVYYWGFAFGHHISEPVATQYRSMIELFASLDSPMMLGPMTFDVNQPLTEKLELMFDDSDTGNIVFIVEEKHIHAHKTFLKLRSDHFKRMFGNRSCWKESKQKEVEIKDFTYKSFRTFLFYLYTDKIEPTPQVAEDAIELFKLADYYGEKHLKRRCEQQLKLLITVENFSQIYMAASLHNSKALYDIALDLGVPSLYYVVETDGFKSMPEEFQDRLIQDLPEKNGLVRLGRKRAKFSA